MALRVYIDGYERTAEVLSAGQGIQVSRELEGYASRANLEMLLPVTAQRPQIGEHLVVRDDRNLLRNSNRLAEATLIRSNLSEPSATWGTLPALVEGKGLRWTVTESSTGGTLTNRTYLVEHPLDAFSAETPAVETRKFVGALFIQRDSSSTGTVRITMNVFNGTASHTTEIDFDDTDGSYSYVSGDWPVYVDDTDAGWYRVLLLSQLTPGSSAAMPYVELVLQPNGSVVTCCWQISEVSEFSVITATWSEALQTWQETELTWDEYEALGAWSTLGMTWEDVFTTWGEYATLARVFPDYVDRRGVSANHFLGVIGERQSVWFSNTLVRVRLLGIDYVSKFRRTLVTETYSATSDATIIADLVSSYAPYLDARVTGTATPSLDFSWVKRPLDQCLNDLIAQTGRVWRVGLEAELQYGPVVDELVPYTFGDAHNLIPFSNDLFSWEYLNGVSVNATSLLDAFANGYGPGNWYTIVDSSGADQQGIRESLNASGLQQAGTVTLGEARQFWVRLYLRAGTGITTVMFDDGITFLTVQVNLATGATAYPFATITPINFGTWDWWEVVFRAQADPGAENITLTIYPAVLAAVEGGSFDSALTGEVTVTQVQVCADGLTRYVETQNYASYPQDQTVLPVDKRDWNLESSAQSAVDLANEITVRSNEAGTYSDTQTDAASIAAYGTYEDVITDGALASNAECQRAALAQLAKRATPRESLTVTVWNRENLDVGMFAVVANQALLESRAAGQLIQRFTLNYRNSVAQSITIECAPYSDERVVRAARAALAR